MWADKSEATIGVEKPCAEFQVSCDGAIVPVLSWVMPRMKQDSYDVGLGNRCATIGGLRRVAGSFVAADSRSLFKKPICVRSPLLLGDVFRMIQVNAIVTMVVDGISCWSSDGTITLLDEADHPLIVG